MFESYATRSQRQIHPVIVATENGKLRGERQNGISTFKGIPYAAPTDGANRHKAPQPVAGWPGVREATRLGDRCPQELESFSASSLMTWYAQTEAQSEDCCVSNVLTPQTDSGRRPVMVYIHGGGYITGGGGGAALDGGRLAKFGDVVVVTLNHRLNVFGHLNLSHLDTDAFGDAANAGLLDIIAALGWIRRNIAVFGGDPGSVTLFGQSGGGSKIMVLIGMPGAKGLFHRAINMSGASGTSVVSAESTEAYVDEFLKIICINKPSLKKLRLMSAGELMRARRLALKVVRDGARPVVDDRHVFGGPMTRRGLDQHATIPLLLGNTGTEASFYFLSDKRHLHLSRSQVMERFKSQFGLTDDQAKELYEQFSEKEPERTPSQILIALISETLYRIPMLNAAAAKACISQAPVYVYNFTWRSPIDGGIWGSPHTIDIPFAFGNADKAVQLVGNDPDAERVSRNLMSAFVAFARTGDPSNTRMPEWPPFDVETQAAMTIDLVCELVYGYRAVDRRAASNLTLDPFNRAALFGRKD